MRQLKCEIKQKDYASMDSEGYIYAHPHFVDWPRIEREIECKVDIIEGGLRQESKNRTKNSIIVKKTIDIPSNERLFVNADAFIVHCYNVSKKAVNPEIAIWKKPFPGMKDKNLPEDEVLRVKDLYSYGDYGNKLRDAVAKSVGRYSIDILGFDSTARTMFMRHMPRTVEVMAKLNYHYLYGYTKVADNSMVNLAPILVGDMEEALKKPKFDSSGDININWILPTEDRMDPTKLQFLWKIMKEKYGCESLFNEDISGKSLGLFNYPAAEFQPGFTENPADHYYRVYYLAVYEKWKYEACRDGEQIQNEFISIWRRFAHRYRDICHFGFTFVTTLTHEAGLVIEILDEKMAAHLSQMHLDGDLNNTFSVIMGDHGNRIGAVQRRYHGRIEERMPLMAVRFPNDFSQKYPEEYKNFLENKYKLTSNFDVHKTLHDIVHMRLGENKEKADEGRGISLFDIIPNTRMCPDVTVAENFCMCMIDVSNVTTPLPKITKKSVADQKKDQFDTLKTWLKTEKLDDCVDVKSLETGSDFKEMAINPYSRFGLRTKKNSTAVEMMKDRHKKNAELNYLNFEFTVTGSFKSSDALSMLVRTELFVEKNTSQLIFEPMIQEMPASCRFVSIFDVCQCLRLRLSS
uniref:Bis(5'-adenosyl)-triphosphatase n=1 Tax=Caenorhabditis tropicalis TaxID=1561998 RepID=A0A1I7T563_9PELO